MSCFNRRTRERREGEREATRETWKTRERIDVDRGPEKGCKKTENQRKGIKGQRTRERMKGNRESEKGQEGTENQNKARKGQRTREKMEWEREPKKG